MKKKGVQDQLNSLWGTVITDLQVDLLNDSLFIKLEIHENSRIDFQTLKFIDVSAFYYVKDNLDNRFNFYDREKAYYLELTSINHVENKNYDFQIKSNSDTEWSEHYKTDANIVIEIWDSVIFIEARSIQVGNQVFELKNI
ncbi:hypothetical protein [Planomicrobium sp. Y74]|uniref:YxiG family protein n=1 Tax=Planomicrobium sp. Y74 TaxID=2478977 RepID=UPI000EF4C507|nr:hypothetical protein [Planomicrobium sp. Y74]RLQ92811.1 hypothetical protein D9754_01995 [Planomicrobium sp. Y74]